MLCDQQNLTRLTAFTKDHNLELPFWEDFIASRLERSADAIWIALRRCPSAPMVCSGCGHHCYRVHESRVRHIRELPMFRQPVWLRVPLRRLRCGQCGTRTERVSWLDRHARVTRSLAEFVGRWCEGNPPINTTGLTSRLQPTW